MPFEPVGDPYEICTHLHAQMSLWVSYKGLWLGGTDMEGSMAYFKSSLA